MLTNQELLEKLEKEFPALSFKDANSSNLWLYAYSKGMLYIVFKTSQKSPKILVYEYLKVSEPIFKLFEKSKSKGSFFSQNIRNRDYFPYNLYELPK